LILRPRAVLRRSVATTGRHHLQPVDHMDSRNCTFCRIYLLLHYFHTAFYPMINEASFSRGK
jgi:hypothetical protein